MCIVDWINDYQGFVMSLLTLVYVVATICILSSNKKSADAAATANKQQYSLELLDKRLTSYYCLNEWISIAKSLLIQNFPSGTSLDAFNAMLYNNAKNEALVSINNQINSIDLQIQTANIPVTEQQRLMTVRSQLVQDRFLKRVAMLDAELGLINQIEILFPATNFEKIKQFSNSFSNAVIDSNPKNIENLKIATNQIIDSKTLESLWATLKTI